MLLFLSPGAPGLFLVVSGMSLVQYFPLPAFGCQVVLTRLGLLIFHSTITPRSALNKKEKKENIIFNNMAPLIFTFQSYVCIFR